MESFVSFLPPPASWYVCMHAALYAACMCAYVSIHEYIFDRCVNCMGMYCMYLYPIYMACMCIYVNIRLYTYMVCVYFCVSVYMLYNFVYM